MVVENWGYMGRKTMVSGFHDCICFAISFARGFQYRMTGVHRNSESGYCSASIFWRASACFWVLGRRGEAPPM